MSSLAFGGEEYERVEVEVHGYERSPVGEFYDDNWVRVSVRVSVGAFKGKFPAAFLTSDFAEFRGQLQKLSHSLEGVASFSTLEGQLSLELTGNGRGGIFLKGVAIDVPGTGSRLEFDLELDQSYLPAALEGLDEILDKYPVRAG